MNHAKVKRLISLLHGTDNSMHRDEKGDGCYQTLGNLGTALDGIAMQICPENAHQGNQCQTYNARDVNTDAVTPSINCMPRPQ